MELKYICNICVILFPLFKVCTSSTCSKGLQTIQCEYGCCGSDLGTYCCAISTSVLVVACVVSALVLIAVIAALVICIYKHCKDKEQTRVRQLRLQEQENVIRRVFEPPKPPEYVLSPPEYSEEMPESHFRPPTVSGRAPANRRFRATPFPSRAADYNEGMVPGEVAITYQSGQHPSSYESRQHRSRRNGNAGITNVDMPPPYSEFVLGQIPSNRRNHRRFIRTPPAEESEESRNETNQGTLSDINMVINNGRHGSAREDHAAAIATAPSDSQSSESTHEIEPRVESRAETVLRILRPSRIPTRIEGMPPANYRRDATAQSRTLGTESRQSRTLGPPGFLLARVGSIEEDDDIEHLDIV
ncbi:hypothetical protein DPMN_103417 [Dreissena polymorpha]|uniref:Uncharacterized protein n=1 Tax=Dreissena polymorpha TaxID=45954 RepID=A0A9D4K2M7_DREPO|nr:hypothetical protein DPMN_103417 [Dreissena polymorpha]